MIFVKSLIFIRSAYHSSVVRQSAPEDGVRHVETLPEHEEEGGGGVDDEGVGAGQGGPGADLAEGREDQRENSEGERLCLDLMDRESDCLLGSESSTTGCSV